MRPQCCLQSRLRQVRFYLQAWLCNVWFACRCGRVSRSILLTVRCVKRVVCGRGAAIGRGRRGSQNGSRADPPPQHHCSAIEQFYHFNEGFARPMRVFPLLENASRRSVSALGADARNPARYGQGARGHDVREGCEKRSLSAQRVLFPEAKAPAFLLFICRRGLAHLQGSPPRRQQCVAFFRKSGILYIVRLGGCPVVACSNPCWGL